MSNRNDVHSPKNLVTENYGYVAAFDTQAPGWAMSDWAKEIIRKVNQTNPDRGMNQCHHCGARLRYVAVMEYTLNGDYIAIGETCLENRFELASQEFHRLRKAAELDRLAQKTRTAVIEWCTANPDLAWMGAKDGSLIPEIVADNYWIADQVRKLHRYGNLFDSTAEGVRKTIRGAEAFAARKAAEALEPVVPVVEGKQQITGEVLSVKTQYNDFGSRLVMTVKDDRGFKVWGSVPASLPNLERGDRVVFSATVEKSDRDESFGFFKRPTKGINLTEKVEEVV